MQFTIHQLAKAFRTTANAYLPTLQQPTLTQEMQSQPMFFQISPERDQQEKIVYTVLSAIAHALELAAKEIEETSDHA